MLYKFSEIAVGTRNFGLELLLVTGASAAAKRKQHVAKAATELFPRQNLDITWSNLAFFCKICPKTPICPKKR